MRRSPLLAIFLVAFIDLLGFGLILPLMPFYAESLGASEVQVGLLLSTYALAQFFGAAILGGLSDRYGRRPLLLISQAGTVVGFLILGLAPSLPWLFVSRFIGGAMGGNITVAQAYISDVTDETNRAQGLALIGAAFGLGFILGPVVGGFLSRWGFSVPAFVAAAVATITLIFTALVVTEPPQHRSSGSGGVAHAITAIGTLSGRPNLRQIYLTGFLGALALICFQASFALYAQRRYGFGPLETGLLLAYVGVVTVILQVGLTGRLVSRFGEWRLVLAGAFMLTSSLLLTALAAGWPLLLVSFTLLALGAGLLSPNLQSLLTRTSEDSEHGQVLGVYMSLDSLARVVAPLPANWLLGAIHPIAPLLMGGVLAGVAMLTTLAIGREG